jgi:hypothetical protein
MHHKGAKQKELWEERTNLAIIVVDHNKNFRENI